jgi:hypothetical protein
MPRVKERLRRSATARRLGAALPEPAREAAEGLVLRRPRARWGNLRRLRPFDGQCGWGRGTPVDRVYIERFLELHRADVRGRVLEVGDTRYTTRFGDGVTESVVLDVEPSNVRATLVGDLAEPGSLPPERFDCFVMTQTLQLVAEPETALRNAVTCLTAGGVLLVTVPTITKYIRIEGQHDYWRWTADGLARLVERACPETDVQTVAFGNLVAAIAFLHGLAAEELRAEELDHGDPLFGILACARVRKPS